MAADDLKLAGECFGFTPPRVEQVQGDGVAAAIANADGETSLDLQTVVAVAPNAGCGSSRAPTAAVRCSTRSAARSATRRAHRTS